MATKKMKHRYVETFGIIVLVMALIRCAFPGVATYHDAEQTALIGPSDSSGRSAAVNPSAINLSAAVPSTVMPSAAAPQRPHRIMSVPNYFTTFPDVNDVQLRSARRWGVKPVENRRDAEQRMDELVYIGSSPYYTLDKLTSSIPYLVPRAALLLDDIGRAYFDSLHVKGVPLHRMVVSSVLRTEHDVKNLQRTNSNATEHSCHLYGTTFDISYITYSTVEDPEGPARRLVRDDTLKFVLSEVLRDFRQMGRCHVKYEKNQSCFHITVR